MPNAGLTRARSMGDVARAVRRAGGSVPRMFRQAGIPLSIVDRPDVLIPLRDQLRLVEFAARQIGDDALPARLSLEGGVEQLGAFGRYVTSAWRLETAIHRCNSEMSSLLQSATRLRLSTDGRTSRWTYSVTENVQTGRQKNEILALGYMLDLLTRYFGVPAGAARAELPGPRIPARTSIEQLFGCNVEAAGLAAVVFPAEYLGATNRTRISQPEAQDRDAIRLPRPADFVAYVERMIHLGLLDGQPREAWLCRRLGMSARTLQRALFKNDTSFRRILHRVLIQQAAGLLDSSSMSITQIALELGYSDPAHFTRAFVSWCGVTPQSWRKAARTRAVHTASSSPATAAAPTPTPVTTSPSTSVSMPPTK